MGGVGLGIFAGRDNPIVAGGAVINYAGVIKHRVGKRARNVTDSAILAGYNVARILADGTACATIMTTIASFTHNFRTRMVDKCVGKINGIMAGPAILDCASMEFRVGHSPGSSTDMIRIAIMAGRTIISDFRVIENGGCEGIVGVANVTILARW